jgi:hypothetical protein
MLKHFYFGISGRLLRQPNIIFRGFARMIKGSNITIDIQSEVRTFSGLLPSVFAILVSFSSWTSQNLPEWTKITHGMSGRFP